jgi:tRNA threonylcarbamoyl adenosine modification protein YjeE
MSFSNIRTETDLSLLAQELAAKLKPGDRVLLEGPMGSGKTTFARYLLAALGAQQPSEGSPTFPIVHEYRCPRGEIIHLDFYRLNSGLEIEMAGIPGYFWERDHAIIITEWLSAHPSFRKAVLHKSHNKCSNWFVTLRFSDHPEQREILISLEDYKEHQSEVKPNSSK